MKIRLLGVPMDLGAGRRGVDMGPSAIRIAGITEKLSVLGHTIIDDGDILIKAPEMQKIKNHRLKYFPEIVRACNLLAKKIEKTLAKKQFPLVLGGKSFLNFCQKTIPSCTWWRPFDCNGNYCRNFFLLQKT